LPVRYVTRPYCKGWRPRPLPLPRKNVHSWLSNDVHTSLHTLALGPVQHFQLQLQYGQQLTRALNLNRRLILPYRTLKSDVSALFILR
jgi:hypothetical protein